MCLYCKKKYPYHGLGKGKILYDYLKKSMARRLNAGLRVCQSFTGGNVQWMAYWKESEKELFM